MMTIKQFANLCQCNTQTLRYYDKIDLLKPVKVDQWSGYRYYTESQAIDFVKIKNLQAADFSIDEIKKLLTASDRQVYEAFDLKIMEQAQKLERIKQIQQSYLTEKNDMEKLIHELSGFLTSQLTDFSLLEEFGLTAAQGEAAVAQVKAYLEQQLERHLPNEPEVTMIVNDQVIHGAGAVAEAIASFTQENLSDTILLGDERLSEEDDFSPDKWITLWEIKDWHHVYEFIEAIPAMEEGKDYCLYFRLSEEKYRDDVSFPLFMISAMLPRINSRDIVLSCCGMKSTDGQNYFALMRKP